MTWVATAISVAGVAVSAYGASKSAKAGRASARAADASAGYYNTLADISQDQYDIWKTEGLPLLQELAETKKTDIPEEQSLAADAVRTQYAAGRDRTRRALEGVRNPADPGYAQILASTYGAEASDVATAMTAARRAALDRDYARTVDLANMYRGFPGQAMTGLAAAGAGQRGVGALQGNLANMYGNWSGQAAQAAGDWWSRIPKTTPPTQPGPEFTPYPGSPDPTYGGPGTAYNYDFDALRHGGVIDGEARRVPDYAEGGKIKGPGTGTSDSVGAIKRPGTYILSADTVRAVGTKKLNDFMEKAGVRPGQGGVSDSGGVPVRLSNGEYAMPPEVTSYFGEDFFNKLQQKYHRPVFADDDGVANGGAIRRRGLPRRVEEAIFRAMPDEALMRR